MDDKEKYFKIAAGIADALPGCIPGTYYGVVSGTVSVTVTVKDKNGNDASIYGVAP